MKFLLTACVFVVVLVVCVSWLRLDLVSTPMTTHLAAILPCIGLHPLLILIHLLV